MHNTKCIKHPHQKINQTVSQKRRLYIRKKTKPQLAPEFKKTSIHSHKKNEVYLSILMSYLMMVMMITPCSSWKEKKKISHTDE